MRVQNFKITGGFHAKHRRIDTQEPVVVAVDEKVSGYRQVGKATGGGRGLITARLYQGLQLLRVGAKQTITASFDP